QRPLGRSGRRAFQVPDLLAAGAELSDPQRVHRLAVTFHLHEGRGRVAIQEDGEDVQRYAARVEDGDRTHVGRWNLILESFALGPRAAERALLARPRVGERRAHIVRFAQLTTETSRATEVAA